MSQARLKLSVSPQFVTLGAPSSSHVAGWGSGVGGAGEGGGEGGCDCKDDVGDGGLPLYSPEMHVPHFAGGEGGGRGRGHETDAGCIRGAHTAGEGGGGGGDSGVRSRIASTSPGAVTVEGSGGGCAERPKPNLPANLDLDAFLRTLHASEQSSV
jgi:hypothetical protein